MSDRPIASSSLSCATPRVSEGVDLDFVSDSDGVGDSGIEPLRSEEGGPVNALSEPSVSDFVIGFSATGCSTVSVFCSTGGSGVGICGASTGTGGSCDSAIFGGSENDDVLCVGSGVGALCIAATAGGGFISSDGRSVASRDSDC